MHAIAWKWKPYVCKNSFMKDVVCRMNSFIARIVLSQFMILPNKVCVQQTFHFA